MNSPELNWQSHERTGFVQRLVETEALSALLLVGGLMAAIAWASLSASSYSAFITTPVHLPGVPHHVVGDLSSLSANGFMVLFFFAIGLELARERTSGALSERSSAILPVASALGGMAGAAGVFVIVATLFGEGGHLAGWGIPMPTDVALGLAALSLSANPAAGRLRVFLLALAVADDVASVIVLAFASHSGEAVSAAVVVSCWVALAVLFALGLLARRRGVGPWWFVALLVPMWWALARLGIEPTLAGVAVGFLAPSGDDPQLPGLRLERVVAPLSAFVVLPLFALLAAGVDLSAQPWAGQSGLVIALVAARVVGKAMGIVLAAVVVVRLGFGGLPAQVRWRHLGAMGVFCGIGFTVSLLFAEAAFGTQPALMGATKVALIGASVLCAVIGLVLMAATNERVSPRAPDPSDS